MLRATASSSSSSSSSTAASRQAAAAATAAARRPPPTTPSLALALATTAALAAATCPPAAADSLADFWRSRQAANGGIKLLAPLRSSEMKLEEAMRILAAPPPAAAADAAAAPAADAPALEAAAADTSLAAQSDAPTAEDLSRALAIVRASSLNCYAYDASGTNSTIEERASLFQQSLGGGADPCTWRIIIRNVTTLEPAEKRAEGLAMAQELVRSYQLLDALVGEAADGRPGALDRARGQADQTLRIEREIEAFVRGVLKV
jgi:hypothetical protein